MMLLYGQALATHLLASAPNGSKNQIVGIENKRWSYKINVDNCAMLPKIGIDNFGQLEVPFP
jgi:hypothetical protein